MALPVRAMITDLRHKFASKGSTYGNVRWLSHHIPKTAGRSLEQALVEAFGAESLFEAYSNTTTSKRLNKGEKLWTPATAVVIHGHFCPHKEHIRQFPNAQRIIWIRDPLDRAISLMRYILRTPGLKNPAFHKFRKQFSREPQIDKLIENFLTNPELFPSTRIYERYLTGFSKTDFAFIGRTEHFEADLRSLSDIMKVELRPSHVNRDRQSYVEMPCPDLKTLLKSEYDFLKDWLSAQN